MTSFNLFCERESAKRSILKIERSLAALVASMIMINVSPAFAQLEEVVVTARKRAESLQDTPVAVSAFNKAMLEANAIGNVEDLATLVPALNISETGSGVNPLISLRGVSSASALLNASTEQAVSINLDGVQSSNAMALRLGQLDVSQVEVLKGPQALFFGKNSPGGVIAIRTADPTTELYSELRLSYENTEDTTYGHAIVSGPLSDTVGGRIAISYAESGGYLENEYPGVADKNSIYYDEVVARGTLTWFPTSTFDLKTKLTYSNRDGGTPNVMQLRVCDDSPLLGRAIYSDCELNDKISIADPSQDPNFDYTQSVTGLWKDKPSHEYENLISSVEINWDFSERWSLSSLTGYSNFENQRFDNFYQSTVLVLGQDLTDEALSQEFRFTGNYDDWQIMAGAYYDDRTFKGTQELYLEPTGLLRFFAPGKYEIESNSLSFFVEVSHSFNEQWELSVGGRYTEEEKKYKARWLGDGIAFKAEAAGQPFLVENPDTDYNNFSPEVTLSYFPTADMMFYASYREGFKAGGFDGALINAAQPGPDYILDPVKNDFSEEKVGGFELGAKTDWLEGRLRLNAAAFHYQFTDRQVTSLEIIGGLPMTKTLNAAEATTQGVELEASYIPLSVEGLVLNATFGYLDAKNGDFVAPCSDWQKHVDQTGCDIDLSGDGIPKETQLDGKPLAWSPEYSATLGGTYQLKVGANVGFRLNLYGVWTDEQYALGYGDYDPRNKVDDYWLVNAGVGFHSLDDAWSIEFIGKNITDEVVPTVVGPSAGSQLPLEPQQAASIAPRQLLLQLTIRPHAWMD